MKILWICQKLTPEADALIGGQKELKNTGGWILGMAGEIIKHSDVELAILASSPLVNSVQELEGDKLHYFALPVPKGENDKHFLANCKYVNEKFAPDMVHIHGSEYIEGLLWVLANGSSRTVVSLQGILTSYADYYYSGMSQWDILSNITLRDLYRGTLFSDAKGFRKRAVYEQKLLKKVSHAIGRTFWDKALLWSINPKAEYHFNNEVLREEFYSGESWQYEKCHQYTIFVNQAAVPYKGLQQLIKALPIIRTHFPQIKVIVAGYNVCDMSFKRKVMRTGYGKYLIKLMRKMEVEDCFTFTGPLNASDMRCQMLHANLFLLPSAIENSPNALGEAQMLGVPCVSSRVGGVEDMIPNDEMGSMYRFSDINEMAYIICKVLKESSHFDNSMMRKLSAERHDKKVNSEELLSIYHTLCASH